MSVHKKLMEARIKLQNTELKKSGENKFAKYNYFELGDFIPTVQTIFSELGLCGVVSFGVELATLVITDTEDNSFIMITSPMAGAELKGCHPIQNLGASQTYLRRYLWVAALEIVEHDVLDATTGKEGVKVAKSTPNDVWDKMDEVVKQRLQGIVDTVRSHLDAELMDKALDVLKEVTDTDEKVAAWSRFDSKERSAIKKAQQ